MKITKNTIIGELVAQNYRTASIFKQNKIDFCCNGNRTIADAAEQKKLDVSSLLKDLELASSSQSDGNIDFNSWHLDLLADYIEKTHHRYVEAKIPEIMPYLQKVVRVHGDRYPELFEVFELFKASAGELTTHMKKEELILFPFVRKMIDAKAKGEKVQASFGSVQNPIKAMMVEHDNEGERFRTIADLTEDYTPPVDACNTYRVTYALLEEFENDLHKHIHLENNILFPKAIALEEEMVG